MNEIDATQTDQMECNSSKLCTKTTDLRFVMLQYIKRMHFAHNYFRFNRFIRIKNDPNLNMVIL